MQAYAAFCHLLSLPNKMHLVSGFLRLLSNWRSFWLEIVLSVFEKEGKNIYGLGFIGYVPKKQVVS